MSGGQEPMVRVERTVGFVLRLGVTTSSLCLGAGLLLGLLNVGLASHLFLQAGVLVLLATPIMRVIVTVVEFFAERDWVFVVLTAIVLVELAGSIVAALVFKQRG